MAGNVKILVNDNNFIEYLGQYGPIASPTTVPFKSALYIAKEGHDVQIVTSANQQVPLDNNRIEKMLARNSNMERIWNEIIEEEKEEEEEDFNTEDLPDEDETEEETPTPSSEVEEEEEEEDTDSLYESVEDVENDDSLDEEEKQDWKQLLEEEEGDGPVIKG